MFDISDAARIAVLQKSVFPLTNRAYRLALPALVTVAKDERIFSKLKFVEHCATPVAYERDITDISIAKLTTACRLGYLITLIIYDVIYFLILWLKCYQSFIVLSITVVN